MRYTSTFGLVLLIAGVVLIIVGLFATRSLADNLSSLFTGHPTQSTMWYLFGGAASAIVGFLLTVGVLGKTGS